MHSVVSLSVYLLALVSVPVPVSVFELRSRLPACEQRTGKSKMQTHSSLGRLTPTNKRTPNCVCSRCRCLSLLSSAFLPLTRTLIRCAPHQSSVRESPRNLRALVESPSWLLAGSVLMLRATGFLRPSQSFANCSSEFKSESRFHCSSSLSKGISKDVHEDAINLTCSRSAESIHSGGILRSTSLGEAAAAPCIKAQERCTSSSLNEPAVG